MRLSSVLRRKIDFIKNICEIQQWIVNHFVKVTKTNEIILCGGKTSIIREEIE